MSNTDVRVNVAKVVGAVGLIVTAVSIQAVAAEKLVPLENFAVPEGFEVTLWAQSPQLRNPTNMDIDAQGRIWVAEGANYRKHEKRDPQGDRIVILEDTDGDGRADKSSVFVQEPTLIAPLGIAVIDNKVVVSNAPDLIVYTDVDRNLKFDPRIDKREVLLTGFDGRNHDHSLHSVTVGPDGRWHFSQGNAGAMFTDRSGRTFRIGSDYDPISSGSPRLFGFAPPDYAGAKSDDGHVYVGGFAARMRPDGTQVEIIGHNFRNSYEQTVTSFGDVFQNDNDDPPACRTTWLMEYGNLGFASRDGSRTWMADRRPGQSIPVAEWRQEDPGVIPAGDVYGGGAPTGIVFYEGDALGPKWRGLLLSADAGRNTILGYLPKPQGAGYTLDRIDFFTSNKEKDFAGSDFIGKANDNIKTYFRPSDVAVGTDGAIYVADWFDPGVGGHQDRDEGMSGAIYRITPKGVRLTTPRVDLTSAEGQIAALKNPAVNVRCLGYASLKAQGDKALTPVAALLQDENPFIRARAVWLLADLGPAGLKQVERLLTSSDPQLRVVAFRALRSANHNVLQHARVLVKDSSPAVRREVALALRDVPLDASRDLLLALAQSYDGEDRSYLEAWGIGCTGKEAEIYAVLAARQNEKDPLKWSRSHANLVWRLTPAAAADAFATRAASTQLAEWERKASLTALGFIPSREASQAMLRLAQQDGRGFKENLPLWWLLNYKESRWKDQGIGAELKRLGVYDESNVRVVEAVLPTPPEKSGLPSIGEIAKLTGDSRRGETKSSVCLMCHRIGNAGTDYAPVLTGWASNQTAEVTIGAIVDPSADIAHGFYGTELLTTDGIKVQGIPLSRADPFIIQSMGGVVQMIPAARIAQTNWMRRSLMLSAEQLGLKAQDVADIVAYLQTVK